MKIFHFDSLALALSRWERKILFLVLSVGRALYARFTASSRYAQDRLRQAESKDELSVNSSMGVPLANHP